MATSGWLVREEQFNTDKLQHLESVLTIGNGYLGTRGSFEEGYPGAQPSTLINGLYDDAPIVHTELANCPNWLPVYIFIDGERFRLDRGQILDYERTLDLHKGILHRTVRWQSESGKTVQITFERFASLAFPHVVAIRCAVESLGDQCQVEIQSLVDGFPENDGATHWEWIDQGIAGESAWLHTRTRHSEVELGMAARLGLLSICSDPIEPVNWHNTPGHRLATRVDVGQTLVVSKLVTIFTSRETKEPGQTARETLARLPTYQDLLATHQAAWKSLWQNSDIVVEGDLKAQIALRLSLYHVLIATPQFDDRVSIPAKTLSGFGYRGHVFWDTEIFCLPFLTHTQPHLARNLLTYRYHTLSGARAKARLAGYRGAMYAWESAGSGHEVTPRFVPDAKGESLIRIWCGDIELHITSDVAYAVWQYWQATGDDRWMADYGAEIVLDTAIFWSSRVEWNRSQQQYEITDVIGPDENHEHVDNNAFTNHLVIWHLSAARHVWNWLEETCRQQASALAARLGLTNRIVQQWQHIADHTVVRHDPDTGLIEQCNGFFDLEDTDLASFEPRTRSMQAILGIERTNQCQVLKQADVLMLLYLLREQYDRKTFQVNWDYYAPRTDHTYGSSLGPSIHAIVASLLDMPDTAYEHYMRAALVDLENVRGNAREGIHAASAGGLWQATVFGFAGIELTPEGPVAHPHLPGTWTRLQLHLVHRNKRYTFDLGPKSVRSATVEQASANIPDIRGVIFDLDGVLTDTAEYHYQGWKRLADEIGVPFDREANEALRGVSRRESLMLLLNGHQATEPEIQNMMARKNRYYQELLQRLTPDNILPGALDLLAELKAAGVQVAIGSASKNARTVIDRLGIGLWIDAISDGYSVEKQKPAPDLFLHAAGQLGLQPGQCLVVDDAESGVQAARAGGMWAVGLGPVDRVQDAHTVLPSLENVHWPQLLEQLATTVQQ